MRSLINLEALLDRQIRVLRFVIKVLANDWGYSLAASGILAIGIGMTAGAFSAIDSIVISPMPYGEGLYLLRQDRPQAPGSQEFSVPELADFTAALSDLAEIAEYHQTWRTYSSGEMATRADVGVVSANYFSIMGIQAAVGRTFVAEDDLPAAPPVALLGQRFLRSQFAGDTRLVGTQVRLDGVLHTVVGVLPPHAEFPRGQDIYLPRAAAAFRNAPTTVTNRNLRFLQVIAKTRSGTGREHLTQRVAAATRHLSETQPAFYSALGTSNVRAIDMKEFLSQDFRPLAPLFVVLAAFTIGISAASVVCLALVRADRKAPDAWTRRALGESRAHSALLIVVENGVVAMAALLLGLLLIHWTHDFLAAYLSRFSPRAAEMQVGGRVWLFAGVVTAAVSAAMSLSQALAYDRRSRRPGIMAAEHKVAPSHRVTTLLTGGQLIACYLLVVGAISMAQHLTRLERAEIGVHTDKVMTMRISLNGSSYVTQPRVRAFYDGLLERLASLPGVDAASVSGYLPLASGTPFQTGVFGEGQSAADAERTDVATVSNGFFDTVALSIVSGRSFGIEETPRSPRVAIVSKSLEAGLFGQGAVGRTISIDGGRTWITIVGVAADTRRELGESYARVVYLPLAHLAPAVAAVLVRTPGDPKLMAPMMRAAARSVDPEQAVDRIASYHDIRRESAAPERLATTFMTTLAGVSILVAIAALGSTVALGTTYRKRELAVRLALGASPRNIAALVCRQAVTLAGLAVGGGLLISILGTPLLQRFFTEFEVSWFSASMASLLCVTLTAASCLLPVWGALRQDIAQVGRLPV